ncbi:MAG: hypothetical protein LBC44_01030 [Mycoplasmataceae bacterium]|jgi:hypothetical protein|nr:hypothetical protein [Mycoplasmataceae bacterium]
METKENKPAVSHDIEIVDFSLLPNPSEYANSKITNSKWYEITIVLEVILIAICASMITVLIIYLLAK